MSFAKSYLGQLRAHVGSRPLLVIGVRVLIEDAEGRILILKRSDTGDWGLPAGSLELGESLMDAIHREAKEETNATLEDVQVFGVSSNPAVECYTYPNGDQIQNVSILATARLAAGTVIGSNDGEADAFRFVAPEAIEQASFSPPEFPAFGYFRAWRETGQFQFV